MLLDTLLNSAYGHSLILISILLLLAIFTKFSMENLCGVGVQLFFVWVCIEIIFVLRAEYFWSYLGHLTLAWGLAYLIWLFFIFISDKIGRPSYGNNDYGLGLLIPLALYPFFIFYLFIFKGAVLIFEGAVFLWHSL